MSCPDIYLGPDRANAPPAPFWTNPAIDPPTLALTEGIPYTIQVTARNHGTDDSPETRLELYWSDPTTGFMAVPSRMIGETLLVVPAGIALPPSDGQIAFNFSWTPDSNATSTNLGHVCLLARLRNISPPVDTSCSQQVYGPDPTIDPLSAIRNVHVYAPPPPPPDGGGEGGEFKKFMAFAFAATNTLQHTAKTRLLVRPLHPEKHEKNLRWLAADPAIHRGLGGRCLKFAEPKGVLVAAGRERILVPRRVWDHRHPFKALDKRLAAMSPDKYRLSHLGPVQTNHIEHLLAPKTKPVEAGKAEDVELLPGEMRHTMVLVEPADLDGAAHIVEVEHTGPDGERIGGLTLVFLPPCNWFGRK
ncbi:MAG: hypothetical protein R3B89_06655 [Polyangiaceae bacterium]